MSVDALILALAGSCRRPGGDGASAARPGKSPEHPTALLRADCREIRSDHASELEMGPFCEARGKRGKVRVVGVLVGIMIVVSILRFITLETDSPQVD